MEAPDADKIADPSSDIVIVDMDDSDRDDMANEFKHSEIAFSDCTKVKSLQGGHTKSWRLGQSVGVCKPEKFVVKATREVLSSEELWRKGLNRDAVEPLDVAADLARDDLRVLIEATGSRRAALATAMARTEDAAKDLRQKHGATTFAIEAGLNAAQAAVEKQLDEVKAVVADAVRSRKQALLAAADATLLERSVMFEAQRVELSDALAEHAKVEATCTDDLGKEDEAIVATQAHAAGLHTPYVGSFKLATRSTMEFELPDPGVGELVVAAAGQITAAVAGFLARLKVTTEHSTAVDVGTRISLKDEKLALRAVEQTRTATLSAPECTGHRQHGVFFNLMNTSGRDLELVELELLSKHNSPVTQRLYTRTSEEGCGGAEKSPGMWREVGSAQVKDENTPGVLKLSKPEIISAGSIRGFHLHSPDTCYAVALHYNKGAVADSVLRSEPMGYANSSALWQGSTCATPQFGPCGKFTYTQRRAL